MLFFRFWIRFLPSTQEKRHEWSRMTKGPPRAFATQAGERQHAKTEKCRPRKHYSACTLHDKLLGPKKESRLLPLRLRRRGRGGCFVLATRPALPRTAMCCLARSSKEQQGMGPRVGIATPLRGSFLGMKRPQTRKVSVQTGWGHMVRIREDRNKRKHKDAI